MWVAADGWDELWVVVRGGEGWVAKMVYGLLWWLCCGLWWWLDCGLQWVAKMVVVRCGSSLVVAVDPMRKRHWGSLLVALSSMSLHVVVFPPLLYTILSIHNHRDLFKETREEKSICDCDGESPILFSFQKSFHYKRMKNGGTFKFNK